MDGGGGEWRPHPLQDVSSQAHSYLLSEFCIFFVKAARAGGLKGSRFSDLQRRHWAFSCEPKTPLTSACPPPWAVNEGKPSFHGPEAGAASRQAPALLHGWGGLPRDGQGVVWGEAGLWGPPAPSGSPGQMETCPLNSPFCEGAAPFLSKAHAISPEQTDPEGFLPRPFPAWKQSRYPWPDATLPATA